MAFRIVEGVPGSGKSYFIVHWLATEFCCQLKDGRWVIDPSKQVRVITNISGLQVPHEDFQTVLDEAGGFAAFFTIEYQQRFSKGVKLLYLLDEAQRWFRPKHCKLTHENLLYFEWARHQGHDIWLITQHVKKLDFEVACLAEYIVQAQPRSNQIANELTYIDRTFDGDELRIHRLVFSKKIASLYKSEDQKEAVKIVNHRMRKYMAALAVCCLIMFFSFRSSYRWWNHYFHPEQETAAKSTASALPSSSPGSVPKSSASVTPGTPASPSSLASTVSSAVNSSQPQVEFYMYRLDWALFNGRVSFLLGISWIPLKDFPYTWVKRGDTYWAMIPAVLLPALQNGDRALPIRTKSDKG